MSDKKGSGSGHEHPIDFGIDKNAEIACIKCQEDITLGSQGRDENGLVLCCRKEKGAVARESIWGEGKVILQGLPCFRGLGWELDDIPICFVAAVEGSHKIPFPFVGNRHDEAGK